MNKGSGCESYFVNVYFIVCDINDNPLNSVFHIKGRKLNHILAVNVVIIKRSNEYNRLVDADEIDKQRFGLYTGP